MQKLKGYLKDELASSTLMLGELACVLAQVLTVALALGVAAWFAM